MNQLLARYECDACHSSGRMCKETVDGNNYDWLMCINVIHLQNVFIVTKLNIA